MVYPINKAIKFSVLISVYAREKSESLDRALGSVLVDQTLKPSEMVLVADGPLTHELYGVIDKYRNIFTDFKLIRLPRNEGLGRALNAGLEHCSYEWVARMDSDDISLPQRFETQMKYIESHPETDVISAWMSEFSHDPSQISSLKKVPQFQNEIYTFAKHRNPINHPAVIFRKASVIMAGGYQHCLYFEDYWLWIRMLNNGAQFYNIQQPLLLFRSPDSMYQRRGGISYIKNEYRFQKLLVGINFISTIDFIKNILVRGCFRIIPNNVRVQLYKKILRSHV